MNLLQGPDYALIVRVEDLGGNSPNARSNTVRVDIAIIQNLWINPGPVMIRENLQAEYPMLLVSVSLDINTILRYYGNHCPIYYAALYY